MTHIVYKAGYPDGVGAPVAPCPVSCRLILTAVEAGIGENIPGATLTLKIPGLGLESSGVVNEDGVGHFDVMGIPEVTYPFTVTAQHPDRELAYDNTSYNKEVAQNTVIATTAEVGYAYTLRMHLDADRDGAIDDEPANYTEWSYGEEGEGGVLLPVTRTYGDEENVAERMEVVFKWTGTPAESWQEFTSTLTLSPPKLVRAYTARTGTTAVDVGTPIELMTSSLCGADKHIRVWLEAADFPASDKDEDALVTLTFDFKPPRGGDAVQHKAVVRIAPWIMSSDLDATGTVYARNINLGAVPDRLERRAVDEYARGQLFRGLAGALAGRVTVPFEEISVSRATNPKGFMRDVVKCGYASAPHANRVVVLKDLDAGSPIESVHTSMERDNAYVGVFKQPPDLPSSAQTGQDNGGNYLVSPPIPGYPYGRIIYGDDGSEKCHAGAFFKAQRHQKPIVLDSTWMDVGHVDEFLSIVPDYSETADAAKPFKVLIASPRLAFLLLWASARQLHYPQSGDDRLEIARGYASAESNALYQRPEAFSVMKQRLGTRDTRFAVMGTSLARPEDDEPTRLTYTSAYAESMPVPDASDGKVVLWTVESQLDRKWDRLWGKRPAGTLRWSNDGGVSQIRSRNLPRECYLELQKDIAGYLSATDESWAFLFDTIQKKIDASRKILAEELDIDESQFIEVPVLAQLSEDKRVFFESPDSINLLALNTPGDSCTCLVPQPFGPVLDGEFVFERYVKDQLEALGLTVHFINDLPFSLNHGEIHCGTNQLPPVQPNPQWWLHEPHA